MRILQSKREIKQLIAREVKQTRYYKRLVSRNFRRYSEYADYKSIAIDMAVALMTADTGIPMKGLEGEDPAYVAMLFSSWIAWNNPTFPVYAIKRELAEAFMHTETPSHVCAMQQVFKHGLFLIPNNLIRNPDGKFCTWLFVTHFLPGDYFEYEQGYRKFVADVTSESIPVKSAIARHDHKFGWATTLDSEYAYSNIMELPSDGDRPILGEFILRGFSDETENLKAESQFTKEIDNLILQTMLYMQTPNQKQLLVVPDKSTAQHQTRGFDRHSPQDPIWIGADYRQNVIKKSHQGGTHASPTTHWRRGHWRFIPVTRDSDATKPVWVRPTIVNG